MDKFLYEKMEEVNRAYFRMTDLPAIRWSKGSIKKRYRKITFGSYDFKKDQIRIHPVLKDGSIPGIVLDYVLFHELLHFQDREALKAAHAGFRVFRRRNRVHDREFHGREKEFPRKKEACHIMRRIAGGTYQPEPEPREFLFESVQ